jgi:hypothetical protein
MDAPALRPTKIGTMRDLLFDLVNEIISRLVGGLAS